MWPFKRKARQRRLEVRRALPAVESVWQRFRRAGSIGPLAVAVGFYVALVLLDVWPIDPLPYRQDQYVANPIYARVGFKVPDAELIRKAKDAAEANAPAVFQLNPQLLEEILSSLRSAPQSISGPTTTQPSDVPEAVRKRFAIDEQSLVAWQARAEDGLRDDYQKQIEKLREQLISRPIIRDEQYAQQEERPAKQVTLVLDGQPIQRSRKDLHRLSTAPQLAADFAQVFDRDIRESVANYLRTALDRPTYVYDQEASEKAAAAAVVAIDENPPPHVFNIYNEGQRLVPRQMSPRKAMRGHRLDAADIKLLRAEHREYVQSQKRTHPLRLWTRLSGRAGMLLLIALLLCLYVARYEPAVGGNTWQAATVAAVLLLMLVAAKVLVVGLEMNERVALMTVMIAGMLLTIAYSQRFALAVAAVLALLTVYMLRGDLALLIVLTAGAAVAVLQLREIRTRTKLLQVGAISAAAVFLVVWVNSLANWLPWRVAMERGIWAAGSAMLVAVLVEAMLPAVERLFRVATSMTLLEWCDASKPLLKRLAMDAPGTFNHSLQLGAMCEAAAEAINARGLLARVGAYYHDVGKINKPDYFVENQPTSASRHAKLSPAMSLLIITGHVKDGLELARQYGLPRVLHEFITSHHGTTLVQYFYHAAAEQRKAESERAPDEVEFRYPGPKPRSKEAAILLLADAAESSVRSMSDPTPGRIENQVHTMVSRRLMDGQLDECDLTLKEAHQIEASLVKSLCGIYHARIAYPTPTGQKPSAAEMPSGRRPKPGAAARRKPDVE